MVRNVSIYILNIYLQKNIFLTPALYCSKKKGQNDVLMLFNDVIPSGTFDCFCIFTLQNLLTFYFVIVQNENFERVLNPNYTRKPCKMELKPISDAMGQVLIQCGVQESTLSVYNEECGYWHTRKHTWLTGVCEYNFKKSYRLF